MRILLTGRRDRVVTEPPVAVGRCSRTQLILLDFGLVCKPAASDWDAVT